jgi:hypothetical protein
MKVTTTIDREPLQDALFENVDRVMRAAGWRAASTAPYVIAPREGRYSRKLDGSLVSVATLGYDGVYHEPKTTERYAEASVGVTFPAAERLLAALRAPREVTVAEDATLAAGLDDDFHGPIRSARDIGAAVAEAIELIEAGAARIAADVPDVDALIACHLDHDGQDDLARYVHPAILAALGRADDAQRALARYRRDPADPRFDAYADELEARLAAGATVPPSSAHAFRRRPCRSARRST